MTRPPDRLALQGMVTAGADARTVRCYFVPDEAHDAALNDVLAEWSGLGAVEPDAARTGLDPGLEPGQEPTPPTVDDNDHAAQLPTVTITGRRVSLADDLAAVVDHQPGRVQRIGAAIGAGGAGQEDGAG